MVIRDKEVECDHSIWAPLESKIFIRAIHTMRKPEDAWAEEKGAFCCPHEQLHREIQDWSISSVLSLLFTGSFWFILGFTLAVAPCGEDALQGESKVRKRTEDEDLAWVCWSISLTLYFCLLSSLQSCFTKTTQACSRSSALSVTSWHCSRFHCLSSGLRAVGDLAYYRRSDIQAWRHELRMVLKNQLLISQIQCVLAGRKCMSLYLCVYLSLKQCWIN